MRGRAMLWTAAVQPVVINNKQQREPDQAGAPHLEVVILLDGVAELLEVRGRQLAAAQDLVSPCHPELYAVGRCHQPVPLQHLHRPFVQN